MHSNILAQLKMPRRDKKNKYKRTKRDERRWSKAKDNRGKKIRSKAGRDELFMSCPRRGQLWPVDTR